MAVSLFLSLARSLAIGGALSLASNPPLARRAYLERWPRATTPSSFRVCVRERERMKALSTRLAVSLAYGRLYARTYTHTLPARAFPLRPARVFSYFSLTLIHCTYVALSAIAPCGYYILSRRRVEYMCVLLRERQRREASDRSDKTGKRSRCCLPISLSLF